MGMYGLSGTNNGINAINCASYGAKAGKVPATLSPISKVLFMQHYTTRRWVKLKVGNNWQQM